MELAFVVALGSPERWLPDPLVRPERRFELALPPAADGDGPAPDPACGERLIYLAAGYERIFAVVEVISTPYDVPGTGERTRRVRIAPVVRAAGTALFLDWISHGLDAWTYQGPGGVPLPQALRGRRWLSVKEGEADRLEEDLAATIARLERWSVGQE